MRKDIFTFIKEHSYVDYCECIIYKDGTIEYACPNHLEVLIRYTGETKEQIYGKMNIFDSPIDWLVQYTGCIAVYTNGYLKPNIVTSEQQKVLDALIKNNLVSDYNFRRY
jgi:hypothetical protein